jgi:hypothetical protein
MSSPWQDRVPDFWGDSVTPTGLAGPPLRESTDTLPRPCGEVLLSLLQKGVVVLQVWIKRQRRQIDSGSRRNHRARIGRRRTAGTACRSQKERKRECQRECEREYEQRARATKSVGSGHRSPRGVGKEKVRFSWRHHSGRQRAVKSYARPNGPAHANRCLAALRGRKPLGSRRERSRPISASAKTLPTIPAAVRRWCGRRRLRRGNRSRTLAVGRA